MNDCQHEWAWLPQVIYTPGTLGQLGTALNVECRRCGARDWKHGMPPAMPVQRITETPRQERS